MNQFKYQILNKLDIIEEEESVKILYAVESGSRAWGFESTDSDYDIRFIYIHKPEWYLSIDERRDVIERPINNLLDITGWDIRKALKLFHKSNPQLLEWMNSPIIYLQHSLFIDTLRTLGGQIFSPKACLYHYLNMAKGNYKNHLLDDKINSKNYFYVLRPVMACSWIENNKSAPPMEFQTLLDSQISDSELKKSISSLLERKKAGEEMDLEPRIDIINEYLNERIQYFNRLVKNYNNAEKPNTKMLNILFQDTLKEVWG